MWANFHVAKERSEVRLDHGGAAVRNVAVLGLRRAQIVAEKVTVLQHLAKLNVTVPAGRSCESASSRSSGLSRSTPGE